MLRSSFTMKRMNKEIPFSSFCSNQTKPTSIKNRGFVQAKQPLYSMKGRTASVVGSCSIARHTQIFTFLTFSAALHTYHVHSIQFHFHPVSTNIRHQHPSVPVSQNDTITAANYMQLSFWLLVFAPSLAIPQA